MYDFVKPNNNENALIERAKELGIRPVLVYEFKRLTDAVKKKNEFPNQLIGVLIRYEGQKSIKIAKEFKRKVDFIIGSAGFKEPATRLLFSSKHFDFVIDVCSSGGTMHTHYQYANVNQVTAKLAKENSVGYCINLSNILRNYSENRSLLMSRMMQNVKVFQKYKVPVCIASFAPEKFLIRNAHFFKAMLRLLGLKAPRDEISVVLNAKLQKKDTNFVKEGVRVIE